MVVQDLNALTSYKELEELCEKVLSVDTMKELDDKLEAWKNCTAQVKLLVGGISKSSQNLSTHLSNAARQVQREADKKRKQAETKEVAEAKKKAKAAAKKVKEQEDSTPPIFQIGLDKLQETSLANCTNISRGRPRLHLLACISRRRQKLHIRNFYARALHIW